MYCGFKYKGLMIDPLDMINNHTEVFRLDSNKIVSLSLNVKSFNITYYYYF